MDRSERTELERRIAATQAAMRFADEIGADVVINRVGQVPAAVDDPRFGRLAEVLAALAAYGDRVGVRLAAQTGAEPPTHLAQLLAALPEHSLGVDLHPCGLIRGGQSPAEAVSALGPHVIHVHACDAVRDLSRGQAPGRDAPALAPGRHGAARARFGIAPTDEMRRVDRVEVGPLPVLPPALGALDLPGKRLVIGAENRWGVVGFHCRLRSRRIHSGKPELYARRPLQRDRGPEHRHSGTAEAQKPGSGEPPRENQRDWPATEGSSTTRVPARRSCRNCRSRSTSAHTSPSPKQSTDGHASVREMARAAAERGADVAFLQGEEELIFTGLGGPADVVFDFVGSDETLALAARFVARGGLVSLVGEAGGELSFSFEALPPEASLTTTSWGSADDLRDVYLIAQRTEIAWVVLQQTAKAVRDAELLELVQRCHEQTRQTATWLRSRIKESAAQVFATS